MGKKNTILIHHEKTGNNNNSNNNNNKGIHQNFVKMRFSLRAKPIEQALAVLLLLKVMNFVLGLHWAKEQGFTNMQLSGFYTLIHVCLQNLEEGLSLEENWKEVKKYFVGIGETSSEEFGKD